MLQKILYTYTYAFAGMPLLVFNDLLFLVCPYWYLLICRCWYLFIYVYWGQHRMDIYLLFGCTWFAFLDPFGMLYIFMFMHLLVLGFEPLLVCHFWYLVWSLYWYALVGICLHAYNYMPLLVFDYTYIDVCILICPCYSPYRLDPLPFGCNGDALHVCMICLPFYLDLLVTIYIYI